MIEKFWNWIDSRSVVRRIVLFFTVFYMTPTVTYSAWLFAHSSHFDGIGTAAIIAAITAPTAALQGFAFRDYINGKGKSE